MRKLVLLLALAAGECCLGAMDDVCAANANTNEQAYAESPRIAVFGGSFSCIKPSVAAKNAWAKALGCEVDTYGVGGCGFEAGRPMGNDVSGQVKRAIESGKNYKAFVLWASGNDVRYSPKATSNGVERAVKLIREKAPKSKIVLLNSIDEPFRDDEFRAKLKACAEAQVGICAKLGVPVLDLHGGSGITKENGRKLVGKDNCHMTVDGYRFITPMTTEFLVRNLKKSGAWEAADVNARDFGARGDGNSTDTAAIQRAIDAVAANGGGRVTLTNGVYASETLYLRNGVELHLAKDAVLLGSSKWSDYDDVDDPRIGKVPERSKKAFIAAIGCENVAITGEGTIDGQGVSFYDSKVPPGAMFAKPPHPRTRMVEFVECRNIRFEDVEFKDSPGWTFWLRNCENIVCSGLRIHGDQRMINNDGLHFDGCRHVRVGGCDIKTGDDCIIMRANRMPGGGSLCEDLIVSNCTLNSNCQAVRLGCPSDDTIRNGLFKNIRISGNNGIASIHPVRYLQPNCNGYCRMENLRFEDCTVDVRGTAVLFTVDPGIQLRAFGNVTFDGLALGRGAKIVLDGSDDSKLINMDFKNVTRIGGSGPIVRGKSDSWEAE